MTWRPRWSTHAWLGQTWNFVQISNGQAVPLGPGIQIGKYQNYLYLQSGEYWTSLVNTKTHFKRTNISWFQTDFHPEYNRAKLLNTSQAKLVLVLATVQAKILRGKYRFFIVSHLVCWLWKNCCLEWTLNIVQISNRHSRMSTRVDLWSILCMSLMPLLQVLQVESILSKLSENEALEIWKKFIEQPGF